MKEKNIKITVNVLAAALISLLLIWGNTFYRQWSQYSKAEAFMQNKEIIPAISAYEAAIHMYTPFSPFNSRSAERLWLLGQDLERSGDRSRALVAYRSLRSSFYGIRWVYSPGTDWIERCDRQIALLNSPQGVR